MPGGRPCDNARMITAAERSRTGPVDWDGLRHFVVLARRGTLSAAARELEVNHATVGRRVAALEASLGRRLFERRGGAFALTEAGHAVLRRAAEMERAAAALDVRSITSATQLAGVVRLTSTRVLLEGFVVPRLGPLRARFPRIELELVGDTRPLSLARHEADLALRMGSPQRGVIVGRRVATVAYAFYASPAVAAGVHDGATAPRIGFDDSSRACPEAAWLARNYPHEPPAVRANGFMAQQLAARAGMGVALLPRFLGDSDPGLRVVPADPPPPRAVWLLFRPESRRDPLVRAVADYAVELFAANRELIAGRPAQRTVGARLSAIRQR